MFGLLCAAVIGGCVSKHTAIDLTEGCAGITVNYDQIWADAFAFFTWLGSLYKWFINAGRETRSYFDDAILPWLNQRGISISLPTIDLPRLPEAPHLN
ncbi:MULTISPECIES: hypothetical protein [Leptolyngbya]|uniref:hypothetical protein n=1 Tax=Leptolyngbya TaxID=47251 RepID=UPI00168512BC|nr:hypothetical protein [Leptolyngbya sp. FACHB-1624]MBD1857710.1 hypothetical protein [Leptolyngbya sp. FACHB-1624]